VFWPRATRFNMASAACWRDTSRRRRLLRFPRPSAFSLAASRLLWPSRKPLWYHYADAHWTFISSHTCNLARAVLALASDSNTAASLATLLAALGLGSSRLTVLEALGEPASGFARRAPRSSLSMVWIHSIRWPSKSPALPLRGFCRGVPDCPTICMSTMDRSPSGRFVLLTLSALAPRRGEFLGMWARDPVPCRSNGCWLIPPSVPWPRASDARRASAARSTATALREDQPASIRSTRNRIRAHIPKKFAAARREGRQRQSTNLRLVICPSCFIQIVGPVRNTGADPRSGRAGDFDGSVLSGSTPSRANSRRAPSESARGLPKSLQHREARAAQTERGQQRGQGCGCIGIGGESKNARARLQVWTNEVPVSVRIVIPERFAGGPQEPGCGQG